MSDRKPWEEEWEAFERCEGKWRIYPDCEEECATFWEVDGARPKLAASAPDLYRALAAVEWINDKEDWPVPTCASCGGLKPGAWRAAYGLDNTKEGHAAYCATHAALKKARGET